MHVPRALTLICYTIIVLPEIFGLEYRSLEVHYLCVRLIADDMHHRSSLLTLMSLSALRTAFQVTNIARVPSGTKLAIPVNALLRRNFRSTACRKEQFFDADKAVRIDSSNHSDLESGIIWQKHKTFILCRPRHSKKRFQRRTLKEKSSLSTSMPSACIAVKTFLQCPSLIDRCYGNACAAGAAHARC